MYSESGIQAKHKISNVFVDYLQRSVVSLSFIATASLSILTYEKRAKRSESFYFAF